MFLGFWTLLCEFRKGLIIINRCHKLLISFIKVICRDNLCTRFGFNSFVDEFFHAVISHRSSHRRHRLGGDEARRFESTVKHLLNRRFLQG